MNSFAIVTNIVNSEYVVFCLALLCIFCKGYGTINEVKYRVDNETYKVLFGHSNMGAGLGSLNPV
jgi:hypothetical protein